MANSLQGRVPPSRLSKQALLKTHKSHLKKQGKLQVNSRQVKQPVLTEAYQASTKSIKELEIIPLSDLKVETHHRGQGIIVKTISPPFVGAGNVVVVEDEHGNVDKLAVYNVADSSILSKVPEGCILAVKEPYYKFNGGAAQDDFLISVDHPSDVIFLRFSDPIIPGPLRIGIDDPIFKSYSDWRNVGDKAFLERDFPTAVFCYTEALDLAAGEEPVVRTGILAKRAGTNLFLGCYDAAKADALASRTGGPADWKAYLSAGRAAYGLWDYQASKVYLQKAMELNPDSAAAKKDYARCLVRIQEETTGNHDFRAMFAALNPQQVHMDAASFFANVTIAESAHHGRGVFATRPIKAGELIFCEKAGQMPNQYEPARASAALYAKMAHQLFDNPSLAPKVLALYGGEYPRTGAEGTIVDGVPIVDVFLLESIRTKNCFSAPLSTLEETKPNTPGGRLAKGLWTFASHMNHSCAPSTHRSFIGDLLISRATRDIAAGEEVFQNYTATKAVRSARQAVLLETWGFACHCPLCEAEKTSPETNHARRRELLAQLEKMAGKRPPQRHQPDAVIRSMDRMTRQLEDLHEPNVYDRLPRLMLVLPTMWAMQANKVRRNHAKVVRHAYSLLRNFGYHAAAVEESASDGTFPDPREMWNRAETPSVMTIHVVTALRDAAESHRALGQEEQAARCEEAARFGYRMITGFEDDVTQLDEKKDTPEKKDGSEKED